MPSLQQRLAGTCVTLDLSPPSHPYFDVHCDFGANLVCTSSAPPPAVLQAFFCHITHGVKSMLPRRQRNGLAITVPGDAEALNADSINVQPGNVLQCGVLTTHSMIANILIITLLSGQALKAQALTLLASWVVADPTLAVANRLHQQDLPNRILEDLVNRAHQFLPGPHAGMAVQV